MKVFSVAAAAAHLKIEFGLFTVRSFPRSHNVRVASGSFLIHSNVSPSFSAVVVF